MPSYQKRSRSTTTTLYSIINMMQDSRLPIPDSHKVKEDSTLGLILSKHAYERDKKQSKEGFIKDLRDKMLHLAQDLARKKITEEEIKNSYQGQYETNPFNEQSNPFEYRIIQMAKEEKFKEIAQKFKTASKEYSHWLDEIRLQINGSQELRIGSPAGREYIFIEKEFLDEFLVE
jgi:hypothetical protein